MEPGAKPVEPTTIAGRKGARSRGPRNRGAGTVTRRGTSAQIRAEACLGGGGQLQVLELAVERAQLAAMRHEAPPGGADASPAGHGAKWCHRRGVTTSAHTAQRAFPLKRGPQNGVARKSVAPAPELKAELGLTAGGSGRRLAVWLELLQALFANIVGTVQRSRPAAVSFKLPLDGIQLSRPNGVRIQCPAVETAIQPGRAVNLVGAVQRVRVGAVRLINGMRFHDVERRQGWRVRKPTPV